VAAVTDKAREISVDRLDERVPVPGTADEVGRLAETFNAMLDRLEAGVESQRRLIADASHELRTPLTAIRGEAEVALMGQLSPEEYRRAMRSILESSERMSDVVDSLLLRSP